MEGKTTWEARLRFEDNIKNDFTKTCWVDMYRIHLAEEKSH